ncbi:MAG: sulfite exporter TauE/SafE family protein [Nitrospirae bacterium]|nr:sulfite exporter TauE/SafE family protein [Candidatus Troglogloeales bacterium]MBI3598850.1 sulfite exporter TauE/SafE family protein [Candidatus Troglogloeales bacterium]
METVSYTLAFSAGLLSFISPCILPLIPSYLSYLTGLSGPERRIDSKQSRNLVMKHAVIFILGFSTIFVLLGASATLLGQFFLLNQHIARQIGGGLIVFFGLYMTGMIKPNFLIQEARFYFAARPSGAIGSFLIGMAFGAGWTPCVGPILGTILVYASLSGSVTTGVGLLSVYALGLAVPFFLTASGIGFFLNYFKGRSLRWINVGGGIFLVVVGALIFTNSLAYLTGYFAEIGFGWLVGQ